MQHASTERQPATALPRLLLRSQQAERNVLPGEEGRPEGQEVWGIAATLPIQQVATTPELAGGRTGNASISRASIYARVPPAIDPRPGGERLSIFQRADEISTILRMLNAPQTSAVILSGEAGVGKSTLAALVYRHVQIMNGAEADTSAVGTKDWDEADQSAVGTINRPLRGDRQGGRRHFVWLSLGPNATLPDVIAAILSGMNRYRADFFFLKPEQQIALLVQTLGGAEEDALVVLDQFEELLNAETADPGRAQGTVPTGRGAIGLFLETLRDADIGSSRLLLTSQGARKGHPYSSGNGDESRIRSYLVSRISIPEGIALLQQRGVQGSHAELSLIWQRCGGHVFALVLFSILTNLSGFSLSYLLNSPDYARMWNGEVTRNLIGMVYYYLNPIQRTLMRALCLFAEPVPLDAIATAIMGDNEALDDHHLVSNREYKGTRPSTAFQRELRALVEMSLVQEQSKGIGDHTYFLHPLLRYSTVEHYLEGRDRQSTGHPQGMPLPTDGQHTGLPQGVSLPTDVLGVAGPPDPMVGNPEARQIALAAGHMRVAGYYARLAQEYCPSREQRTGLGDVEPMLAMIEHLCLGWHWQEAYNLLCAEGLHESMLQWGAFNALIGLYAAMLPPLGVVSRHDFGEICGQLGVLYDRLGEGMQSRSCYEQALMVFREVGDRYAEAVTLANEGELFRSGGEWEKARSNFEQALTLNSQYGDAHLQSVILLNLGLLYQATKDYATALRCYVESLKLAHRYGADTSALGTIHRPLQERYNEGMILSNMGFLLFEQGHLPEATALLTYAVQLRQLLHDPTVSAVIDFLNALEQKMGSEAFARLRASSSTNYNLGTHDLISRLLSSGTQ